MAIVGDNSTTLNSPESSTYKYTLRSYFEEQDTSTSDNTSKVYVEASLAASKIAFDNNTGGYLSIYWYDNSENSNGLLVGSLQVKQCGKTYGTKWIGGTIYPKHKADGTLSGYALAKWERGTTNRYVPYNGQVNTSNLSLTTIPRQATINSATDFNDEGNPTITYTNSAGNSVTTLQACIALTESSAASNPIIGWRDISKTGSSYTFNLTTAEREALRNAMPNQGSRNLWFFVKTILGGVTYYSYKIASISIVNASPTMSVSTYQDTNGTTIALTHDNKVIIQNKSTLQFQFANIASQKGASLTNISMEINGVVKQQSLSGTSVASLNYDFGTINVSENTRANITLTDSRGYTNNFSIQLTIWEYENPTAIITEYREANFYTESHIKVDARYSSLNNLNVIAIKYRIKKTTENNWSSWVTLSDNVEADFNADNQYAWDIQVQLDDSIGGYKLYTINKALDVGIPIVFYDVLKRSVGINCLPNGSESFEVPNKVLLATEAYMNENQEYTFSDNVQNQTNGIVLVWSAYSDGQARNWTWNFTYIPKYWVANHYGNGVTCTMFGSNFSNAGCKYVYVSNTSIKGNAANVQSGTSSSGITFNNSNYVLRYVIGV